LTYRQTVIHSPEANAMELFTRPITTVGHCCPGSCPLTLMSMINDSIQLGAS